MKKFISVLLICALACTMFVACGKKESETQTAAVTVSIELDDGTSICSNVSVTVEGIDGDAPVALDAISKAVEDEGLKLVTNELAGSPMIDKIGDYGTDNGAYIWELTVNDKEANARINALEIKDGDKLLLVRNEGIAETATDTDTVTTKAPAKTADDGYDG